MSGIEYSLQLRADGFPNTFPVKYGSSTRQNSSRLLDNSLSVARNLPTIWLLSRPPLPVFSGWKSVTGQSFRLVTALAKMSKEQRLKLYKRLAPVAHYDSRQLTELCGVCSRQLRRYFKADLGRTPQEWLNYRRMLAAAHQLLGENSIKRIAGRLEFAHLSNFSREFKRHFGFPPVAFLSQKPLFRGMSVIDKR